ncbi:MAG: hypothetical protein ACLQQ4_07920 [Bacteroidia bacterium]
MNHFKRLCLFFVILLCPVGQCFAQSGSAGQQTAKFTLIDGMISMEYRYMQFTNAKGDSLYANEFDSCLTTSGYQELWDTGGPPVKLKPQFLNKKFNVTYTLVTMPDPFTDDKTVYGLMINKMEVVR